jgi:hypothetical protein
MYVLAVPDIVRFFGSRLYFHSNFKWIVKNNIQRSANTGSSPISHIYLKFAQKNSRFSVPILNIQSTLDTRYFNFDLIYKKSLIYYSIVHTTCYCKNLRQSQPSTQYQKSTVFAKSLNFLIYLIFIRSLLIHLPKKLTNKFSENTDFYTIRFLHIYEYESKFRHYG